MVFDNSYIHFRNNLDASSRALGGVTELPNYITLVKRPNYKFEVLQAEMLWIRKLKADYF